MGHRNLCDSEIEQWDWFDAKKTRAQCPNCRSLDRHRHLGVLLERFQPVLASSTAIVEYGPNPLIHKALTSGFSALYIGIDISASSRRVDLVADACSLPLDSDSVDLAVCFHVLEHIPDDIAALHELRRVLGRGGIALIQSPWSANSPTDEDPDAPPAERAKRFGFKEHVRRYGNDFDSRLEECGYRVVRLVAGEYLTGDIRERLAIGDRSTIWLARPGRGDSNGGNGDRGGSKATTPIPRPVSRPAARPAPRARRAMTVAKTRVRKRVGALIRRFSR